MAFRLVRADGEITLDLADGGPHVVGRGVECDIAISDATISRRHAEISVDPEGIEVKDLASRNGTFVNGTRVDSARASVGDIIALGQVVFRLAPFRSYHSGSDLAHTQMLVRLGGDKRRVAVLFSDIRGFSALSETMTPEAIARLLSEYFTAMVACVYRNGGTLDKFIGDAVMAQWGAPTGTIDDADRAVRAATEMMDALAQLNATWQGLGQPAIGIGIGLSYGEVFAGHVGSEQRTEFTVIGDPVNTASRLCAAAEAGEILMSEAMRQALRHPPPLDARPDLDLKGKARSVPVYRVAR